MIKVQNAADLTGSGVEGKQVIKLFSGAADPTEASEWQSKDCSDSVGRADLDMGMGSRLQGFRNCGHR
ncbi:MAG TPA: hypothetical protein VNI79_03935 [Sphingomicrobium sp.]|nr:hypothetical protein [Sphingomicrobium sp.]